jgi:Flp pilus assembly protein TadG
MLRKNNKNQRGTTLVFLSFALAGLCGVSALALDEGYMWYARNKAQMVADSAVLAYATSNNRLVIDKVTNAYNAHGTLFNCPDDTQHRYYDSATKTFYIKGTVQARAVFGGVVGQGQTAVPAHAKATVVPAGKIYSSAPWGPIADQSNPSTSLDSTLRSDLIFLNSLLTNPPANYTYQTRQITLKATEMSGSTINTMGNFGAIDLVGASGGNDYRSNVTYNSSEPIQVGDQLSTLTGNKVGPTQQGITDRFNPTLYPSNNMNSTYVSSTSPYSDWFFGRSTYDVDTSMTPVTVNGVSHPFYKDPYRQDVNDDHLVVLPLITTPGKNGSAYVTVLGFAVFFIEDTNPSGNSQSIVTGRFVGMNIPGAGGGNPSAVGSTGYASGGGATVVSLSD